MSARAKLFPVTMLALAAGCSPASSGHADGAAADRSGTQAPSYAEQAGPASPALDAGTEDASSSAPSIIPALDPAAIDAAQGAVAITRAHRPPAAGAAPLFAGEQPAGALRSPSYSLDLPPSKDAPDPRPFPDEVTRYMVDRDSCDHFRGEEAYDGDRRVYLQENIAELCTGTDARLAMLRRRYAFDPAVVSALSAYEDRIEGNASN